MANEWPGANHSGQGVLPQVSYGSGDEDVSLTPNRPQDLGEI